MYCSSDTLITVPVRHVQYALGCSRSTSSLILTSEKSPTHFCHKSNSQHKFTYNAHNSRFKNCRLLSFRKYTLTMTTQNTCSKYWVLWAVLTWSNKINFLSLNEADTATCWSSQEWRRRWVNGLTCQPAKPTGLVDDSYQILWPA